MAKSHAVSETTIPGVRIVAETAMVPSSGDSSVILSFFASDRSRVESGSSAANAYNAATAYTIERRDLGKRFQIYPAKRRYQILPIFGLISEKEQERFVRAGRHWRKSVEVPESPILSERHVRHTSEKTGDQKTFFGCTACRWIISQRSEGDPSHGENWSETVSESWYLDSDELKARYPGFSPQLVHHAMVTFRSSAERVVEEHIGERPRGLCAWSETRQRSYMKFPNGEVRERTSANLSKITSITTELFDASIFEPPRGFRTMPVYPSRLTLARIKLGRAFSRLRWRLFNRA